MKDHRACTSTPTRICLKSIFSRYKKRKKSHRAKQSSKTSFHKVPVHKGTNQETRQRVRQDRRTWITITILFFLFMRHRSTRMTLLDHPRSHQGRYPCGASGLQPAATTSHHLLLPIIASLDDGTRQITYTKV